MAAEPEVPVLRFGISADAHLIGHDYPEHEAFVQDFVHAMCEWRPDFVIDLGDFACQCHGVPDEELHDCQLARLQHWWATYCQVPGPAYIVMGNHDVREDITKAEFLAVTQMPGRYYSFDVKGYHFIVLDGNQYSTDKERQSRDGVGGSYTIDEAQLAWLSQDLAANRDNIKVVFCHEELHHTPPQGSGEGGDVPFPPVGKEGTYVGNGWQVREILAADGNVVACFFGHKHRSRWTVYGGVNYITLAALHYGGSYAKVTISHSLRKLRIRGVGHQRNYMIPFSTPSPD